MINLSLDDGVLTSGLDPRSLASSSFASSCRWLLLSSSPVAKMSSSWKKKPSYLNLRSGRPLCAHAKIILKISDEDTHNYVEHKHDDKQSRSSVASSPLSIERSPKRNRSDLICCDFLENSLHDMMPARCRDLHLYKASHHLTDIPYDLAPSTLALRLHLHIIHH